MLQDDMENYLNCAHSLKICIVRLDCMVHGLTRMLDYCIALFLAHDKQSIKDRCVYNEVY